MLAYTLPNIALAVTAPIGATAGAFSVSPSGAATYSIPIVVPPDTNGMAPKLSLNYNSQSGNGLLGMGWSLGGLSVIHRCGATIALDGFKGGVNYDANDKFCLDGERLIYIGNNEYRTQHESWQKIVATDATTNPASFTVKAKDGTVTEYQVRTYAVGTNIVRLWALSKIQDTSGNSLSISYGQDTTNGDYWPNDINYNGNHVVLGYEPRSDITSAYEGGSVIKTMQRLKSIKSCIDANCTTSGTLVRSYTLTYDNGGAVGRSRMTGIQECGTDGVCLPATVFSWNDEVTIGFTGPGWINASQGYATTGTDPGLIALDINGDGKIDLVQQWNNGGTLYLMPYLSNGTGFVSGAWINTGQGFDSTGPGKGPGLIAADLNGDGKMDLVQQWNNGGTLYLMPYLSNGTGFATNGAWFNTSQGYATTGTDPGLIALDINGDGKIDLVQQWNNGGTLYLMPYLSNGTGGFTGPGWINASQGYATTGTDPGLIALDINGDGKIDLVQQWNNGGTLYLMPYLSNGTGFVSGAWINTGQGFDSTGPGKGPGLIAADLNGDGKIDLVQQWNNGGTTLWLLPYLSDGSGNFVRTNWFNTMQGFDSTGPGKGPGLIAADLNGDGKIDLVQQWNNGGTLYLIPYLSSCTGNGSASDLLVSTSNGLGVQTNVTYKPLTDNSVYTKDTGSTYPYADMQDTIYVVSQLTQSDGLGGTNTTTMKYAGLKQHLTANTSLGFHSTQTTDPTGLTTYTYYNQVLDGSEGTAASSATYFGSTLLKSVSNTWTAVALGNGRTLVVPASTFEQSYDLDGSIFPSVTTTYSSYDSYWNAQTIAVSTNDGYSKTTANSYNNDITNWYLGQLTQSQVTASAPSQTNITRTSSFAYDTLNRLITETIEPNQSTYTLITNYAYDSLGNRVSKTVSGTGIVTRTESQAFDPQGRFVLSKTNALNQTETYITDPRYGAVTSLTGPNSLTTTWSYDGFGRKTGESRADGTSTTINYKCWDGTVPIPPATCSIGYATQTYASGAGDSWVYYDMLGRPSRTARIAFNTTSNPLWVYGFTTYDNLGHVISASRPDFSNAATNNTTYIYDSLGRVKFSTAPGTRITTNTYNGLTTSATYTAPNTQTQTKSTVKNSQGQVMSATDPAGTTTYAYDAVGNLAQVTDVKGNVSTMIYNLRGFKTAMHDPDMGNWTYNYDVLGQLLSQTDAKNQTISMLYDKLGRMTSRTIPEGISSWAYDSGTKGIGKLASVTNPNANESYTYDTLGRLSTANTSISGTTYTVTTAYDAYSRVDTITYPETGFKLKHIYDPYSFGFLQEIKNATTNASYWKVNNNGIDAMNRILSETYGNGLIGTHVYNATTGDLSTIQTGVSSNIGSIQNDLYSFDGVGNVLTRSWYDGTATQNETFAYDNLNRLTQVTGPANKTYSYDTIGNITFKSDVGNYSYPSSGSTSVRPHAVTSTSGGAVTTSFTYDANGNLLTGNGKTVTYTSFNKAKTIQKGSTTSTLTYDASFNRIIKSNSSGTTVYIGKLYERNTAGTTVTQKHYIYAGSNLIGAYSKVSNNTTNTRYFHTDHLGSVAIITNETGGVVQRLSYDAWGKRRNVNGTDATSITAQTTRGYTAHEHDDEVMLINMNAREYDPIIGRFISPDTIIPGATNSQAYNRYTYTNNNPLSYTDPTGHWSLRRALQKIAHAAVTSIVGPSVAAAKITYQVHEAAYNAYRTTHKYVKRHVDQTLMDHQWARTIAMAAATIYGGPEGAAAFSAYMAHISGASNQDALRAGATTWASSNAFSDIDSWKINTWGDGVAVIVSSGVVGGVSSQLQGGSFSEGFKMSGLTASARVTYFSIVGKDPNPAVSNGKSAPKDGVDIHSSGNYSEMGVAYTSEQLVNGTLPSGSEASPILRWISGHVPTVNALSVFHDAGGGIIDRAGYWNTFTNYGTMLPAAVITEAAILRGNASIEYALPK